MAEAEGSAAQTAKDLFAGAAGGVAQVLLGQPFDIVKVRLQTSTAYPSALSAASAIWRSEGPLAFYKGTLTPLIGIGACVSVQFGAFHQARRWFEAKNIEAKKPGDLSYGQYYAAGAFAGLSNSVLSGPIEHVRIRLQTQPHSVAERLYKGPLDCVRQLVQQGGGVGRGLFRGQAVTLWREAQAYGVWFLTFEWLMNADALRNKIDRKAVPAYKVAFYGGLAGEALWLASYPFDVVKSKMQTDALRPADQRYKTMRDCFAQTYRQEGFRGFWRGLAPTLLRAMPVSAGTFAVVEYTMRAIN
ncbi:carrier protein ymc1 [Ophiostoma piceae UAMH 11346]|uniref:Carrier protein ymc1 n=1 Tax=Ophiostoma piceae (strain UAMH 11346) TaxID=1262450 RepID=S3BPT3_OPHP1|nr:carrier protein ymc1 [Ophiostoma piceae UAMH 11346]